MGLFKGISKLFSNPEKEALKLLQEHRNTISKAGGSQKLLNSYFEKHYQKNAIITALNAIGLNFEKEPGKRTLQIAVLDLLYEARVQYLQDEIFNSLKTPDITAEDQADHLIKAAMGKGFQKEAIYKMAKLMNGLVARMVSYDDVVAGDDQNPCSKDLPEDVSTFDLAVREVSAEFLLNVIDVSERPFKEQVKTYRNTAQNVESDNVKYWQSLVEKREKDADAVFSEWENTDLDTLKKFVKGLS